MNNKHILDLTLRLSQALDQNYDVVNMETVLSVISALEGTTITKEQLEATRLAKYINQLRRRTKCEHLARRAKSLLKRWREMVGMQQTNESSITSSGVVNVPAANAICSSSTTTLNSNMAIVDNAVSASHLTNPQFIHQHYQRQQYQSNSKQQAIQQHPYHSQPSSPVNVQEKSNPNEFLISMSNPATGSQMPKSSTTSVRKKRKLEKLISNESVAQQQQPTSFANLLTGLSSTLSSSRKTTRVKTDPAAASARPVETFIIEHSSNSNSDLICIPTNNAASSNFTSAIDVPPVVIDIQDTNSSMNSLVSKDVTNASSSSYRNKTSGKKSKKEKKRKDRNATLRQNQPLQDCDDQNTITVSYQNKRPSDVLLLNEKSHSACPTISNISEILSLSNSSMSSVFPSADAMSKNIFQSGKSELVSSTTKMCKSDLTFAGKFKQNTSSTSTGSNVLNYNSESMNENTLNISSPKQNKFSLFGGIETNSNDSSSSSRTTPFHIAVNAVKRETSNSRHNIEDGSIKLDINEKSMSNMSNKGNSSTDNNTFSVGASNTAIGQHQQSIDLTTMDFSSQTAIKQPKKRGRKKGSKGVDSVIAKETSLSSQMLISSLGVAGKKVKTTKELYAEMENRKLRNVKVAGLEESIVNSSVKRVEKKQMLQQQKLLRSRRPSFCSDIADSDSCTMTSEPSRDSGNIVSKITIGKREMPLENNSSFLKHDSDIKIVDASCNENGRPLSDENSVLEVTSKIKLEIQEILKLLTQPPSVKEIECKSFNSINPCSCTVEIVAAPTDIVPNDSIADNNSNDSHLIVTNSTNISETKSSTSVVKNEQMENMIDNVKGANNDQICTLPPQPPPTKVKKSIFDLDFDDDEDPLNSIIADIAAKNFKSETETLAISPPVDDKSKLPVSTQDDLDNAADHQNIPYALNVPTPSSDNIAFPSYEIKFDPDCKARNRFEIQTEKITKFHIDTLHNCFIPNVNGNWNNADAANTRKSIKCEDTDKSRFIIDGYDVVPLYSSDVIEKIVKDISHVKFTKRYQARHSKCQNQNEILFHIPFLGVSRIPDNDSKLHYEAMKKLKTLDEEKENCDSESTLNNNMLNKTALVTNDAKEELEMERIQKVGTPPNTTKVKTYKNLKKSGFKRLKKHATLVKRSTISRLKLTLNANQETNASDFSDTDNIDKAKTHRRLFYHEELCPMDRNGFPMNKECIFHISSCSSGCSSSTDDEKSTIESFNRTKRTISTSSSSTSYDMLDLQHEIIQADIVKRTTLNTESSNNINESDITDISVNENCENSENTNKNSVNDYDDVDGNEEDESGSNDLPEENNYMLLSFNNIYNKSTRDENAELQNKDIENNMLKQQLQNCDDYNNLNNNFNLIKYIDNKTSSINNNNNNSCSNNYSDTNINISSSSCTHENTTNSAHIHQYQHYNNKNNDNDVQIKPFKEYQTGIRAVDEDVNDDDGNNCGRLQQFKEWHEVLQLRSYNDELLTVLPYVVLE